jgi:hypothetical protein
LTAMNIETIDIVAKGIYIPEENWASGREAKISLMWKFSSVLAIVEKNIANDVGADVHIGPQLMFLGRCGHRPLQIIKINH